VEIEEVARRFSLVNADLAKTTHASISVGFSELQTQDALEDLIARADLALYRERRAPPASD
jgi:PleD family two-component response regulator